MNRWIKVVMVSAGISSTISAALVLLFTHVAPVRYTTAPAGTNPSEASPTPASSPDASPPPVSNKQDSSGTEVVDALADAPVRYDLSPAAANPPTASANPAPSPGATPEPDSTWKTSSRADGVDTVADRNLNSAELSDKEPWWATLVGKIAWPVGLLLAVILALTIDRLRRFCGAGFKMVRSIKAGGIEMEISVEAADAVRKELRKSFRELIEDARVEYERMAEVQNLDRLLASVVEDVIFASRLSRSDIRATLHVRDIVFKEFLYQLVDYYPKGGGAHRRFSQRYGIIGRSWRSGKSHGTGNAFGKVESEEALIEHWGMTHSETHGVLQNKHSCLSIVLRAGGTESGILYLDSSKENTFGEDKRAQAFARELETRPSVIALAEAVERAMTPLRAAGPNLDLKDVGK
ncbi:hypothetical protein KEU06_28145 [Pseudaminobacter sp. 19-2017]|uniref:GAF domain-containing protein n=1 Tax=Pseudaminobacter soli (ex Zhang et al. 2022) TaxID=2831468 RepID=A0A942E3S2_9HYPH|nr:hypothetical protein [Pseudaminobacter soli]MBS3652462.1 hypothetical protein [Pseudaminobacter soli]